MLDILKTSEILEYLFLLHNYMQFIFTESLLIKFLFKYYISIYESILIQNINVKMLAVDNLIPTPSFQPQQPASVGI